MAQVSPTPEPAFDQAQPSRNSASRSKEKSNCLLRKFLRTYKRQCSNSGRQRSFWPSWNSVTRSLGVNCTHCHVPEKWDAEDKRRSRIAGEMSAMVATLNGTMLKGIKNLKSASPTVNCTTCHRGEVKPGR